MSIDLYEKRASRFDTPPFFISVLIYVPLLNKIVSNEDYAINLQVQ